MTTSAIFLFSDQSQNNTAWVQCFKFNAAAVLFCFNHTAFSYLFHLYALLKVILDVKHILGCKIILDIYFKPYFIVSLLSFGTWVQVSFSSCVSMFWMTASEPWTFNVHCKDN